MDSLEVGVVEIGCIFAPNHCQHRHEAPKRLSATPAAFCIFGGNTCSGGGVVVLPIHSRAPNIDGRP